MSPASPAFDAVVFDLDHTLFDFEASKRAAFLAILRGHGLAHGDDPDAASDLVDRFTEWAHPLWQGLEAGELTLETLNIRRFSILVERAGLDADAASMADDYLVELGRHGGLLPGARRLLDDLAARGTPMALASNGYGEVQRARLTTFDLGRYFDAVVISGETGLAKPDPAFFEPLLADLGRPDPGRTLMVGDSLSSDMAGGRAAGMTTCWFRPGGFDGDLPTSVDHVVATLGPIADLVWPTPPSPSR